MAEPMLDHAGKFHPFHRVPTDDVILKSSENMLFKVGSWRLARAR